MCIVYCDQSDWWYVPSTIEYEFQKTYWHCYKVIVWSDMFIRVHCWWTFRPRGYHHPSSQHFGDDMNISYMLILINFLCTKTFRKPMDFLIHSRSRLPKPYLAQLFGILGPQCSSTLYLFGFLTVLVWASLVGLM